MKKVYIVPHTHWDREWYLPFEQHRLRLIWLIDDLLEVLEDNPMYHHFHLDGQSIILDDYLEVKPKNAQILKDHIRNGRLSVGPWYILQDEYLISDEANVRNMLIGLQESEKYGQPAMLGYFPDAFGNISQAPQILRGFGIDNAIFGRGINAVGFNNTINTKEAVAEYPSEMTWRSPDGSEVTGIFMANWYNNGGEIPENTNDAVDYLTKAVADAKKVSVCDTLLLMNGSDHQPVQKSLPDILKRVEGKVQDTEFLQGSLSDFVRDVIQSTKDLKVYSGEMNSQHTEGWWTLTGTASSRIYLKQMNDRCQKLLENYLEPVETLAFLNGKKYAREELRHAWKSLLKNHPHDSICGCSVDEVHDEMVTRFNKTEQFAKAMLADALDSLLGFKVVDDIGKDHIGFKVYNPLNWKRSDIVKVIIDLQEGDSFNEPVVVDDSGHVYACKINDMGRMFDYTLPNDGFRKVAYVHRYEFEVLLTDLAPLSMSSYKIVEGENHGDHPTETVQTIGTLENEFLVVRIEEDGSLTVLDKETGNVYEGLNTFEDCGDIGNEYMFIAPEEDYLWESIGCEPTIECLRADALMTEFVITYDMSLPASCNKETSSRDGAHLDGILSTRVRLVEGQRRIDIVTAFHNRFKDHRLRVRMPSGVSCNQHHAHGQYDVLERPNLPWVGWKNPSNSHKQRYFVSMDDQVQGLMIANKGLMEYEILDSKVMAITLLRSVGELGDWGVFPTPGAQCMGESTVEYSIIPYSGNWQDSNAYRRAYEFNLLSVGAQCYINKELRQLPLTIEDGPFIVTALKACETRESIIVRLYSVDDQASDLVIRLYEGVKACYKTNLKEERKSEVVIHGGVLHMTVKPKEIVTIEIVV